MPSLIHFCMKLFKVICISSDLPTDATAARVIKNFASLCAPMILSFGSLIKKKVPDPDPWSQSRCLLAFPDMKKSEPCGSNYISRAALLSIAVLDHLRWV